MFQVLAPVTVNPTAEARQALGAQLRPAGRAAWREIARRGQGLEFAHLQFCFAGVTLAVCSRLRADGFIAIEIGLGNASQAARVVTAAEYRRLKTECAPQEAFGETNTDGPEQPALHAQPRNEPGYRNLYRQAPFLARPHAACRAASAGLPPV